MSEFQHVAFRAVDQPLNDKQLAFAQQQSSRAEVTRWSLSVEYHYSSFRGDVNSLLKHGFDVYLQYTNYGTREIKLRLPTGLPFPENVWQQYIDGEHLQWKADAKGPGGILTLEPFHDSGGDDEIWDREPHLEAAVQLRDRLISGDLRALYVMWLCAADDDYNPRAEMIEPPVPHGISDAGTFADDFLWFFGLDPLLLAAAGRDVPPAPSPSAAEQPITLWLQSLDPQQAKQALEQLLVGDTAAEKARLLAEIRLANVAAAWPTSNPQRTLEHLLAEASQLRDREELKQARLAQEKAKQAEVEAERQRQLRMQEMVKEPKKWLREAERLADQRGTANYKAAADILGDLREAIGGDEGDQLARRQAKQLASKYPTLNHLKSSLRKRGLLG